MESYFKKFKGWLVGTVTFLVLTIMGLQTYLKWKNNEYNRTRLEIEHSGSLEERKRKQEEKDNLDKAHKQAQIDATKGWQANDTHYKFQSLAFLKIFCLTIEYAFH